MKPLTKPLTEQSAHKQRAPGNRTLTLGDTDVAPLKKRLITLKRPASLDVIENKTIHQDIFEASERLPDAFADLVFVDPPYNLTKTFGAASFRAMEWERYEEWLDSWMQKIVRLMKPRASIYLCGDWRSGAAICNVARRYFQIQNRITFEREKGRGAKSNWKNCSEDIWFCTLSKDYYFDVEAVKIRRKVIAPYRDANGRPKDWRDEGDGKYRVTHPSNVWADVTIPFWSMPENTDHPTQKPEKLLAKIILASSKPNDVVFDPFAGSGTTAVVAAKLGRRYVGVEIDEYYCCLAEKRLERARYDKSVQGYADGVFRERNTPRERTNGGGKRPQAGLSGSLFGKKSS